MNNQGMIKSADPNETRIWIYSFVILLAVSVWMLVMRLLNTPFLADDFVALIVYLPTFASGIIALYFILRRRS